MRGAIIVVLAGVSVTLAACDAGKAPYDEAVTLEEQGKLAEAAEKFDAVCRRAPGSKLCPTATIRAAAARIKAVNQDSALADALRQEIDRVKEERAALERRLANTRDPAEIDELTQQLADQQRKLQEMERTGQIPRPAGPLPALRTPNKLGGALTKPCNCPPGDPLCSCL